MYFLACFQRHTAFWRQALGRIRDKFTQCTVRRRHLNVCVCLCVCVDTEIRDKDGQRARGAANCRHLLDLERVISGQQRLWIIRNGLKEPEDGVH